MQPSPGLQYSTGPRLHVTRAVTFKIIAIQLLDFLYVVQPI